jgi:hypothetical protein
MPFYSANGTFEQNTVNKPTSKGCGCSKYTTEKISNSDNTRIIEKISNSDNTRIIEKMDLWEYRRADTVAEPDAIDNKFIDNGLNYRGIPAEEYLTMDGNLGVDKNLIANRLCIKDGGIVHCIDSTNMQQILRKQAASMLLAFNTQNVDLMKQDLYDLINEQEIEDLINIYNANYDDLVAPRDLNDLISRTNKKKRLVFTYIIQFFNKLRGSVDAVTITDENQRKSAFSNIYTQIISIIPDPTVFNTAFDYESETVKADKHNMSAPANEIYKIDLSDGSKGNVHSSIVSRYSGASITEPIQHITNIQRTLDTYLLAAAATTLAPTTTGPTTTASV